MGDISYNDISYNDIIYPKYDGKLGKYIQTHISEQGILRIFYTDEEAEYKETLYCSIVQRSNYKQVINDSGNERSVMDNDGMNSVYYGGPYNTYEYKTSNALVPLYPPGGNGPQNSPQHPVLSGIQKFQIFLTHDVSDNVLYNTEGYSTERTRWWDGKFDGWCFFSKGGYQSATGTGTSWFLNGNVPDVYQFVNAVQSMPNSLSNPEFVGGATENPDINVFTNNQTDGYTKAYSSTAYPITGNYCAMAVPNIQYNTQNFSLIQEKANASGGGEYATFQLRYYCTANDDEIPYTAVNFKINDIPSDCSNMYCDIDLDISTNTSGFYGSNAYGACEGKPYYIFRDERVPAKKKIWVGCSTMDWSKNAIDRNFIDIDDSGNQYNIGASEKNIYYLGPSGGEDNSFNEISKFHKIKCQKNSQDWNKTNIHVCFTYGISQNKLIYQKFDGSGNQTFDNSAGSLVEPFTKARNVKYEISWNAVPSEASDVSYVGFCSLDLYEDNPHIAWFDASNGGSIYYAWSDNSGQTWKPNTDGSGGLLIDSSCSFHPSGGQYVENNNKNYLSLVCDPNEADVVHISYFHIQDGIKYWTNSRNVPQTFDPSKEMVFDAIAYGKTETIEGKYIEPYVELKYDLNQGNAFEPLYDTVVGPPYITSPLYKVNNNQIFDATWCDIISFYLRVKTPPAFDTSNVLFLFGGATGNDGAYFGGCNQGGKLFFGIQSDYNSDGFINTTKPLNENTDYELQFKYNKLNYTAEIQWQDMSNSDNSGTQSIPVSNENGGFNMTDGYLTIGSGSHDGEFESWFGTDGNIKSLAVYNLDLSHIPIYEINRAPPDGEISRWYNKSYIDTSVNVLTPYVYDISSSTLPASQSVQSTGRTRELHDLFYLQRLGSQPAGARDLFFRDFHQLENQIWVVGGVSKPVTATTYGQQGILYESHDYGKTWNENANHPLFDVSINTAHPNGVYYTSVRRYNDSSGIQWLWLGSNDYGIFYSTSKDKDGIDSELGRKWNTIGCPCLPNQLTAPGGGEYAPQRNGTSFNSDEVNYFDNGGIGESGDTQYNNKKSIRYVYPISLTRPESDNIFGVGDPSKGDFHLWIGTDNLNDSGNKMYYGYFDMLLRGNKKKFDKLSTMIEENPNFYQWGNKYSDTDPFSNAEMYPDLCGNIIWDKLRHLDATSVVDISRTALESMSFADISNTIAVDLSSLKIGLIGARNYIFATNDGGKDWGIKLQSVTDVSAQGTYVDKNPHLAPDPSGFDYSFNNFSVVMNSTPWNNKPYPLVANNNNNFDLSFVPKDISAEGLATQTWDPSLNKGSYWDPSSLSYPIGSSQPLIRKGGNKYVVDICENVPSYGDDRWYFDNHWVLGLETGTAEEENAAAGIFHKNSRTDTWSRIDINYNNNNTQVFNTIIPGEVNSIIPVDNSGLLLNVRANDSNYESAGIYKLSMQPPIPTMVIQYPYEGDYYKLKILIEDLEHIDISGGFTYEIYASRLKYGGDLSHNWGLLESIGPMYPDISRELILDPSYLAPEYTFDFAVRAKNQYGNGWFSPHKDITTPASNPSISSFKAVGSYLQNRLSWEDPIDTFTYDISRMWSSLDPSSADLSGSDQVDASFSGVSNEYIDYDVSLNYSYIYYIAPKDQVDKRIERYYDYCIINDGIPRSPYCEYDMSNNKLNVYWYNLTIGPETTVKYGISYETIPPNAPVGSNTTEYRTNEEYTVENLLGNYTYKFDLSASYHNAPPPPGPPDPSGKTNNSEWTENTLEFTLVAPIPTDLSAVYNLGTDIVDISWNPTTFYNDSNITYDLQYRTDPSSNFSDTSGTDISTPNYELNGRDLSGNQYTCFRVKANYSHNIESTFSNVAYVLCPSHVPRYFEVKGYSNDLIQNSTDVSYIRLSWTRTTGDISGYSIKRIDTFYDGTDISHITGLDVSDISQNRCLANVAPCPSPSSSIRIYDDNAFPLGEVLTIPRRYQYTLTADYPPPNPSGCQLGHI